MWKAIREFPLTLLRAFSDGLERAFSAMTAPLRKRVDDDDDEEPSRRWWSWIWLIPFLVVYWLFWGALAALTFPVRAWFLPKPLRNCYLRGLPAFGLVMAAAGLIAAHFYLGDRLVDRYRSKVSSKDIPPEKGILYAMRLVENPNDLKREYVYIYGLAHVQANQMEVASAAMADIAPDGELGYGPAHYFRAFELLQNIDSQTDDASLDSLQWHLEQSGSREDERLLVMWARFYQAQAEWDKAADALEQAGKMNPVHFLALSGLEERRANTAAANDALVRAGQGFQSLLAKEPMNKIARLQLAMTLTKMKRFQDAEGLLLSGLPLHPEPEMRRAVAEFFLIRFDEAPSDSTVTSRLSYLTRAMSLDLNFREIYKRLAQLFDPSLSDEQLADLKQSLEQLLVEGSMPAVAHFGLGCVAGLRDESRSQATWHLAQAQSSQPMIAVAYNNLAQVLTALDPPRLDEAERFARQAATGTVQAAALYATLGQVLIAKREWAQAIEVLVPAAEKYPESKEIHSLLATAYEATGELEKATIQRGLAENLNQATDSAKR